MLVRRRSRSERRNRLFGKQGLETAELPKANKRILHTIGYSMHVGAHGTRPADWGLFLDFTSNPSTA